MWCKRERARYSYGAIKHVELVGWPRSWIFHIEPRATACQSNSGPVSNRITSLGASVYSSVSLAHLFIAHERVPSSPRKGEKLFSIDIRDETRFAIVPQSTLRKSRGRDNIFRAAGHSRTFVCCAVSQRSIIRESQHIPIKSEFDERTKLFFLMNKEIICLIIAQLKRCLISFPINRLRNFRTNLIS